MSFGVVLVPGMTCVGSAIYAPLIKQLHSEGITEVHAVDLPSVGPSGDVKPNALEADAASVKAILFELIERKGLNVIIIGHSYGGTPSLCAVNGLWRPLRLAEGKKGGVVRLAIISGAISLPGDTVAGIRMEWTTKNGEIEGPEPKFEMTDKGMVIYPDGFANFFFNDLSESQIEYWGSTLKPHLMETMMTPTPTGDPKVWKLAFLVLTDDKMMPVAHQEDLIERAKNAGAVIEVDRMKSGHFPQISHTKEISQWIRKLISIM